MGLKLENFNIIGGSLKNLIFRGVPEKPIYRGLGQFPDLSRTWQKRGGGVFEGGGETLMDTMDGFLQYLYLKEKISILTYTEQYRLSHISLKHFYLSHLSIEQNIRICCCNKELLTNAWITLSISTNIFLRFHRNIPINKIINVSLSASVSLN